VSAGRPELGDNIFSMVEISLSPGDCIFSGAYISLGPLRDAMVVDRWGAQTKFVLRAFGAAFERPGIQIVD